MSKHYVPEAGFKKEQLMESEKYYPIRYLLMTYLDDDKTYTIAQVEKILERVRR